MNDNAETGAVPDGDEPERAIDAILLNALVDVAVEGSTPVLADDISRELVRRTLEEATTDEQRERFAEAISAAEGGTESDGKATDDVVAVLDAVRDSLADRDVRVVVDHEASFSLDPDQVALYNFARTKSPATLSGLDLPSSVATLVEDGANEAASGNYEAAAQAFVDAVEAAGTGDGAVATRTLAAWAHHWAGDDHGAIDFVEEALHLHMGAWGPKLAGHSSDPDRSFARPQQFRDGKYAAMAVLRYTVDCPDGTDLTASLGLGDGSGEVDEWVELKGPDECTPIPRLAPENTLRLRLTGDVPAFPAMHGYYVGLGILDREVEELREIYQLFLEGPLGDRVSETIRLIPGE